MNGGDKGVYASGLLGLVKFHSPGRTNSPIKVTVLCLGNVTSLLNVTLATHCHTHYHLHPFHFMFQQQLVL